MVKATSLKQLGLQEGDRFGDFVVARVISDGVYGWDNVGPADHTSDDDIHTSAAEKAALAIALGQLRNDIDNLDVTGQMLRPFADTYAGLPAIPAEADATTTFSTWLTADDIGTGDAENPQYPRGVYLTNGGQWDFAISVAVPDVPSTEIPAFGTFADAAAAVTAGTLTLEDGKSYLLIHSEADEARNDLYHYRFGKLFPVNVGGSGGTDTAADLNYLTEGW